MNIRQSVLDTLKEAPGSQMDAAAVLDRMHGALGPISVTREQVSNSLSDLAAWSEITRVSRGVYAYEFKTVPEPIDYSQKNARATMEEAARVGSVSDTIKEDEIAADKFFTQVGTARNGDLLITRDSDGAAYRATPL